MTDTKTHAPGSRMTLDMTTSHASTLAHLLMQPGQSKRAAAMSTSKLAQRLTFESFPDTSLALLFFDDVTNGSEIKESIVAKDASADAAFIDADMTPGPFLVHLAAYKALAAQVRDRCSAAYALLTLSCGSVAV